MKPLVGIIILNFNRALDTIECVESLQQCSYSNMLIWVVDNGSTDGSEETLRRTLRGIEVRQTGDNLGFAAGNNWAFEKMTNVHPKYVLLLNNDTIVDPSFLDRMVEALESDPEAAIAGGTVFNYPDENVIWYAGGRFQFWRASSVSSYAGKKRDVLFSENNTPVTFVTGCLLLFRVDVALQHGLFDTRFFMYFEDCELSIRLHRLGQRLLYVPQAVIYHKVSHIGTTPFTLYYGVRNRFLFVDTASIGLKRIMGHVYLYAVFSMKALWWLFTHPSRARAVAYGWLDYITGNFGIGRGNQLRKWTFVKKTKGLREGTCADLY